MADEKTKKTSSMSSSELIVVIHDDIKDLISKQGWFGAKIEDNDKKIEELKTSQLNCRAVKAFDTGVAVVKAGKLLKAAVVVIVAIITFLVTLYATGV